MNAKEYIGRAHADLLQKLALAGKNHHIGVCDGSVNQAEIFVDGKMVLGFGSLNILGLAEEEIFLQALIEGIRKYGAGCPSTVSLLQTKTHLDLEEKLREFKRDPVSLLNTGFIASESAVEILRGNTVALGVPVSKEYRQKAMILYDEFSHNSLQGPIKSHDGPIFKHDHLDYQQLEGLLEEHAKDFQGRILIVGDALYSMNGTFADTKELIRLAKKYNAIVILDGAHSDGVYGAQGRGVLEMQGVPLEDYSYVVQVGVLSKASSSIGGYITLPEPTCKLMKIANRRKMFTVGRPTFMEAADIIMVDLIMGQIGDERRKHVAQLSGLLRDDLAMCGFDTLNSKSHIVPVVVGSEADCYRLKAHLFNNDSLFVNSIPQGVVSKGSALLRISICAFHTPEHIERLVAALVRARDKGFKFK